MVTYVAAFAATLGLFNIYFIFILAILGNTIPDVIYFLIGRMGKATSTKRYVHRFLNEGRIKKIREYLHNNPWKTVTVIKITPAIPLPGFILTGTTDMKFRKFIMYSLVISAIYSAIFVFLGFYSGLAFNTVSKYLEFQALIVVAAALFIVLAWFILKFIFSRISDRIEKI